jgi:hypothetical protein
MRKGFLILALGLLMGAPLSADTAAADAAVAQVPRSMDTTECNVLLACLSLGFLAVLAVTVVSLKKGGWRLDEALSEETDAPLAGAAASASPVQRLAPSTSRLIAFLGLIASLTLFIGVGFCYIWRLANGVALPNSSDIMPIIYGGAVTFAPYAFNKASEALSNLLPSK